MTKKEHTVLEELKGTANEIIAQVKKLIREGNARRLIIKNKEGKVVFQTQLTAGVAGTAFITAIAPVISAITMFVLFVNDVSVMVERDVDPEEDEYEVEADYIEIQDEEEDTKADDDNDDKSEKTVGKD